MKKIVMMLSLALLSMGVFAQDDHSKQQMSDQDGNEMSPNFENKDLGKAYNLYIVLKDVLVASNATEVKTKANELAASLDKVENAETAKSSANKVAKAVSLEAQRKAFAELSNEMTALLKSAEISGGEVYIAFCPMANASWLSNEKEINNPYFGDKMLRCGKVKETIK